MRAQRNSCFVASGLFFSSSSVNGSFSLPATQAEDKTLSSLEFALWFTPDMSPSCPRLIQTVPRLLDRGHVWQPWDGAYNTGHQDLISRLAQWCSAGLSSQSLVGKFQDSKDYRCRPCLTSTQKQTFISEKIQWKLSQEMNINIDNRLTSHTSCCDTLRRTCHAWLWVLQQHMLQSILEGTSITQWGRFSRVTVSLEKDTAIREDKEQLRGPGGRSQWIDALVTNPGSLNSIPETHTVAGEKWLQKSVLWPLHMFTAWVHTDTDTHALN